MNSFSELGQNHAEKPFKTSAFAESNSAELIVV